jgi:outer membrane protein assembly factor BamB
MQRPRIAIQLCVAATVLAAASSLPAENWPQWRGPSDNGLSRETGLPLTWSKTENVVWRVPLPGQGGSTPVIWNERIFLTTADGDKNLLLMAFNTAGKPLWQETISDGNRPVRGGEGNYASPSPSTDGKHVWVMVGTGEIGCYTLEGKNVWKFNLQDRYGKFGIMFGMASTPVLDGDRLYLQLLHSGGSWVLALDKLTGDEVWKVRRPTDARAECEQSYASPIVYRDSQRALLLTHGADYIIAHRLTDGSEVWRCGGLNPKGSYNPTLRFVASPAAVEGLIVVPSAKKGPILGLDPASQGDISDSNQGHYWVHPKNTPDVPSPLIHDGLVYLCGEEGTLLCLDAKTGEQCYQKRVYGGQHRASPVYADGKIFLTARDGTITVIKPGRTLEVLAQNKMDEQMTSSPAISGGRIYLRTWDALYAIQAAAK